MIIKDWNPLVNTEFALEGEYQLEDGYIYCMLGFIIGLILYNLGG